MWSTKSGFGAKRVTICEYLSAFGRGARLLASAGPALDPFCDDIRVSSSRGLKPIEWLEKVLVDDLGWSTWIRDQQVVSNLAKTPPNPLGNVSRSVDKNRWTSVQREPCRKILFCSEPPYFSDYLDGERAEKNQSLLASHGNCM